jgi:hypothetical protein
VPCRRAVVELGNVIQSFYMSNGLSTRRFAGHDDLGIAGQMAWAATCQRSENIPLMSPEQRCPKKVAVNA